MGSYISYFKESIRNSDLKKAKDLLLDLHLESEETKTALLNELAVVSDQVAWLMLDLIVRLETQHYHSLSLDTYDKLLQLIIDRAHLNFEFAMILYKTRDRKKLLQASPLMKYILTNCTDREILFETINAVGEEKIESLVAAIAEFLYYDDLTLKECAVKTLAQISSPEVYQILLDASKTVKNDHLITETLAQFKVDFQSAPSEFNKPDLEENLMHELTDSYSEQIVLSSLSEVAFEQISLNSKVDSYSKSAVKVEVNRVPILNNWVAEPSPSQSQCHEIKMLGSKSLEERFEAFRYFLKSGSDYLKELIANLKSQDHDLVVNTFRIISNIASEELLPDIYSFLSRKSSDPSLEHEAFEALCSFDKFSFTELMMEAIEKPAIHVRMSAVKALDKNYNDPVYAKVKNRIETGREHGEALVRTIIDSHAENLINYLLVSDTFADIASTYMTKDVAPSALSNYLNILIDRGLKSTAKKIELKADMAIKLKNRRKAMVISSSDTVQRIYEKLLFKNRYISLGFHTPEEAFESISIDKPDLIVSDLFSNEMTALSLAKEIREFYTRNQLPFIISTRQNDFLNINLTERYPASDINGIFKFPGIIKGITDFIN